MSFGHCGLDWLHSLLDSHPEIVIMPAFSFYRSWKIINANDSTDAKDMFNRWYEYIEKQPGMQVKRRKLFNNQEEADRFYELFKKLLYMEGIDQKNVFYAIHAAYAYAKNLELKDKQVLVCQEHLPFYFDNILDDFPNTQILMIVRDPRAVMAGAFRGIWKNYADEYIPDYSFNLIAEYSLHSISMWKKYKNKLKDRLLIVQNEKLHEDLIAHMKCVAQWLGIKFDNSLLRCTFAGLEWIGESSYIKEEEKYPEPLETFYLPENIRKRWLSELNENEIRMIEFLNKDIMKFYNYESMYSNNPLNRLKGFITYLMPNRRLWKHWKKTYPNIDEFSMVSNKLTNSPFINLWNVLPNGIKFINVLMFSVLRRFLYYFLPGKRSKRYV